MKLARQTVINAPASEVWRVVAHDFAKIGTWATAVPKSVINTDVSIPEGAQVGGRICSVNGFGDIYETFTAYDEAGKTYTFEAVGMPFFVTSAHNTWQVKAIDQNTTHVSYEVEMKLMPIFNFLMSLPMKFQLNGLLDKTTEELKYFIEEGVPHPRKQKQLAKSVSTA
ncbi:MAG: SRPBCC family protein [Chloroflexota bacterium]